MEGLEHAGLPADSWEADAIFVGARGRQHGGRLTLGTVAGSIAARAHCTRGNRPVEVRRARRPNSRSNHFPPAAAGGASLACVSTQRTAWRTSAVASFKSSFS